MTVPITKLTEVTLGFPRIFANEGTNEKVFSLLEFPQLGLTDSTGFHLYESAVHLAQCLLHELKPNALDKKVLELGCGSCALTGIALTHLDEGYQVTFTDLPSVLECTTLNVSRNARNPANHVLATLEWGDLEQARAMGEFDLVVGSDLVYMQDYIIPLVTTMWLCTKRHAYVMSEVRVKGMVEDYFVKQAKQVGFRVTRVKPRGYKLPEYMRFYKLSKPAVVVMASKEQD